MFFPANNSAVMANARQGSFGSISGVLRTVQNIGLVGSYVLAISVAAASIPRQIAFQVFIGTTNLTGGISQEFLFGIHNAFYASILILVIAGILSFSRGRESRKEMTANLKPNTANRPSSIWLLVGGCGLGKLKFGVFLPFYAFQAKNPPNNLEF